MTTREIISVTDTESGETAHPRRVAFIGLGSMGAVLAERAITAGHKCAVFDVDRAAMERFDGRAELVANVAEAAENADIILACLATAAQYDAFIAGPEGLIAAGMPKIYVHAGTSSIPDVQRWDKMLADAGIIMVDAPVTGGVTRALAGDLTIMASGPREAIANIIPVLDSFASKIIEFGDAVEAAQVMKLVNNMLNFANLAAACEALVVGAKAGLDPERMLEVINAGSGQNSATLHKFPNHILTGSFDYQGWISHALKDGKAFLEQARELAVLTPVSDTVYQMFQSADAAGDERDDYDITEVIRHIEQAAGITVRRRTAP